VLNDVAYSFGLAWGKVRPTTTANFKKRCVGKHDIIQDKVKLITFPK
jgi:hypothetical protein